MECLLPYLCMVTVPHIMVGLERMLDYRGVRLERFCCITLYMGEYYVYIACTFTDSINFVFCIQRPKSYYKGLERGGQYHL